LTDLLVFALNTDPEVRHTHLTRAQGEAPVLPPLAEWLGVTRLDTGQIELFEVKDLGGMALSDYIVAAFGPDPDPAPQERVRIDALDGSVLLVPDNALSGEARPGPHLTLICRLPLAQPDHRAALPKAEVTERPRPAPPSPAPPDGPSRFPYVLLGLGLVLLIGLILVL
jgi:hypothetical protein